MTITASSLGGGKLPLLTTTSHVQLQYADSPSTIRVRNLLHTTTGPRDAWGRQGTSQPLLLSARVSLKDRFRSSAEKDSVAPDTVHYGLLSKFFLGCLQKQEIDGQPLTGLGLALWENATGWGTSRPDHQDASSWSKVPEKAAFLSLDKMRMLDLEITLPKASLLGSGVSLTLSGGFDGSQMSIFASAVRIQGLRIPTLIGVNANERLARQVVFADITVENLDAVTDVDYVVLEGKVVEVLASSSRETLEALAEDLSLEITKHLEAATHSSAGKEGDSRGWNLIIALEKPTAVPLSDAACVELQINTLDVLGDGRKQDETS